MLSTLFKFLLVAKVADFAFKILLKIQSVLIRIATVVLLIGLFALFAVFVSSVLNKFMPGGSLYVPLPGDRTAEMLSYILPSNTDDCVVLILSCYAAVMVYKYSFVFLKYTSESN